MQFTHGGIDPLGPSLGVSSLPSTNAPFFQTSHQNSDTTHSPLILTHASTGSDLSVGVSSVTSGVAGLSLSSALGNSTPVLPYNGSLLAESPLLPTLGIASSISGPVGGTSSSATSSSATALTGVSGIPTSALEHSSSLLWGLGGALGGSGSTNSNATGTLAATPVTASTLNSTSAAIKTHETSAGSASGGPGGFFDSVGTRAHADSEVYFYGAPSDPLTSAISPQTGTVASSAHAVSSVTGVANSALTQSTMAGTSSKASTNLQPSNVSVTLNPTTTQDPTGAKPAATFASRLMAIRLVQETQQQQQQQQQQPSQQSNPQPLSNPTTSQSKPNSGSVQDPITSSKATNSLDDIDTPSSSSVLRKALLEAKPYIPSSVAQPLSPTDAPVNPSSGAGGTLGGGQTFQHPPPFSSAQNAPRPAPIPPMMPSHPMSRPMFPPPPPPPPPPPLPTNLAGSGAAMLPPPPHHPPQGLRGWYGLMPPPGVPRGLPGHPGMYGPSGMMPPRYPPGPMPTPESFYGAEGESNDTEDGQDADGSQPPFDEEDQEDYVPNYPIYQPPLHSGPRPPFMPPFYPGYYPGFGPGVDPSMGYEEDVVGEADEGGEDIDDQGDEFDEGGYDGGYNMGDPGQGYPGPYYNEGLRHLQVPVEAREDTNRGVPPQTQSDDADHEVSCPSERPATQPGTTPRLPNYPRPTREEDIPIWSYSTAASILMSDESKGSIKLNRERATCTFFLQGICRHGASCRNLHTFPRNTCVWCGDRVEPDVKDMKNPLELERLTVEAHGAHISQCEEFKAVQEERKQSRDLQCGICLKRPVQEGARFGLLSHCSHVFCLECIREWRNTAYTSQAASRSVIRSCPMCRNESHFVIPCDRMVSDPARKEALVARYKEQLSTIPCKYFNKGQGECPFGSSCFYAHLDERGQPVPAEPPRFLTNADGVVTTIRPPPLCEIIETRRRRKKGK